MPLELVSSVASLEGFVGYVSACAAAYKYCHGIISSIRNAGKESQLLEDQFHIEYARFSAWRTLHGLVQETWDISKYSVAQPFSNQEIKEGVLRILGNIKIVCDDIEKLGQKLSLETKMKEGKSQSPALSNLPGRLTRSFTDTSLQSPGVAAEIQRKSTRQQAIKKDVGMYDRFIWAVQDFKRLQQHVSTLSSYNDQLDKFTQPQALRLIQEALISMLPKPAYTQPLETRIASFGGYKLVTSAPSILKAEIDARIAAWRAEVERQASVSHEISSERISRFEDCAKTPWGERTILEYEAPTGRCDTLLEWKMYDQSKISTSDAIKRTNGAVEMLKAAPKGSALLRAVGYVKSTQHEGLQPRVALLYELPEPVSAEIGRRPRIKTLRELLPRSEAPNDRQSRRNHLPKPSLGHRFRLAVQIAEAVGSIHNCGWLHKGLRPENIVFVSYRDLKLDSPSILGWANSRRDAVDELTETIVSSARDLALYQHPDYVGGERYCEAFDHYQLGCLLLEIAHWRLLIDIKKIFGADLQGEDWTEKLIQHAEELKQDVGEIYSAVMVRLLKGLDPETSETDFWFDVVWELQQCCA